MWSPVTHNTNKGSNLPDTLSYIRVSSTTRKFKIFKRDLSESENIKLESE